MKSLSVYLSFALPLFVVEISKHLEKIGDEGKTYQPQKGRPT
jgi:hypothetical protein